MGGWVGGWVEEEDVGRWVEENEAVRMRWEGWVGGWVGTYRVEEKTEFVGGDGTLPVVKEESAVKPVHIEREREGGGWLGR